MTVVYLSEHKKQYDEVLQRVLNEHGTALKRFLRVRLALEADREDIVQEVMLRLARHPELPEKLSLSPDSARNYLITTAANLITDKYRRASVRQEHNQESFDESFHGMNQSNPELQMNNSQTLDMIQQTLDTVKPVQKKAFLLNRLEAKSYRQISEELGVSMSTVERHISQALLAIRKKVLG